MLEFVGKGSATCDGVNRRSFLKVGSLALGGLTLPQLLKAQAASKPAKKRAVILIWQAGGPSHIDMYDLKPNAPSEIRGEFKPIATNVPGIQIGEHLPLQAKIMDKLSILRSACHTNAGHGMGAQWMLTGYQPTIEVNDNIFPSLGSVVAKMKGANDPSMPPYVNLPKLLNLGKAAYLGASYNPFAPDNDPNMEGFKVRNLSLPAKINVDRLSRRRDLLNDLDNIRRDIDTKGDLVGLDSFTKMPWKWLPIPRLKMRSICRGNLWFFVILMAETIWGNPAFWPVGWLKRALPSSPFRRVMVGILMATTSKV